MRKILLSLGLLAALPVYGFEASAVADAAKNRDLAAVKASIAQKADVNATQADGSTALHWASHWDDLDMADQLIKAGADPKATTRLGATPLYLAAENGSPAMIKKLLAAGVDPNTTVLMHGETPLMFAARSGNVASVKTLLDAGAEIDAKESYQQTTALLWAAEQNHADVVTLLLARGANAGTASKVVLLTPPGGRRPAAAKPAVDDDPDAPPPPTGKGGLTALIIAVRERGIESVKALLDAKAPIDHQSADGSTALLVATQNGDADIAKLLIERGANVNLVNSKGWTPLFLAVKARTLETGTMPNPLLDKTALFDVIRMLVEHGADVNARLKANTEVHNAITATWIREPGATAFMRASLCGDLEVMKYLLAHGADPKINTNDGTTALMALSGVGYADGFMRDYGGPKESLEAMQLLIDLGIDVNAKNSDGVIALHGAAHKNFLEGIQVLVDHGGDLTIRSHKVSQFESRGNPGNTPLDWATGVQIGMQSAIYHPEAVALIKKLMTERGIPVEGLSQTKGGSATAVK